MMLFRSILLLFAFSILSTEPLAAEPKLMDWSELAPQVAKIENPFEGLTAEQLSTLRRIFRLETRMVTVDGANYQKEAQQLRARLAADGLDIGSLFQAREKIIEQRRRAAEGINEALVGKNVRLPGFVLPLAFQDGKAIEFLIVPTTGACIHTPPPPPNQMVHVRFAEGIVVERLYAPVWISGKLRAERSLQKVSFVDGAARVAVSYAIEADLVEPAAAGKLSQVQPIDSGASDHSLSGNPLLPRRPR